MPKSIFQEDGALIVHMEHEKCLEMIFCSDAQIEPILIINTVDVLLTR